MLNCASLKTVKDTTSIEYFNGLDVFLWLKHGLITHTDSPIRMKLTEKGQRVLNLYQQRLDGYDRKQRECFQQMNTIQSRFVNRFGYVNNWRVSTLDYTLSIAHADGGSVMLGYQKGKGFIYSILSMHVKENSFKETLKEFSEQSQHIIAVMKRMFDEYTERDYPMLDAYIDYWQTAYKPVDVNESEMEMFNETS